MNIPWDDRFVVGIPEIDAEHREIIETYNQLVDAWRRDDGMIGPATIINELTGRVRYHSAREEALLEDYGLPDAEKHQAEHVALIREFEDLERRFLRDGSSDLKAISLKLIGDKLREHTEGLDRELIRALRERTKGR